MGQRLGGRTGGHRPRPRPPRPRQGVRRARSRRRDHGHPGRVVAYVHGTRPRPYRTEIRLRTLGDDGWERFLDEIAARPDHIAALLDKDIPHAVEAVTGLLPAPGDLIPDCSCPDDGFPCKHAAALCYQSARLLDEDPFVLFLMRGRGEQELLAALTQRNAARSAAEQTASVPPMATVPARAALAPNPGHALPPLPPPLPAPAHPGRPPAYPRTPTPRTPSPWTCSPRRPPPAPTPSW